MFPFTGYSFYMYFSSFKAPPRKNEDELREEEELQLALALSQSEAEAKEKEKMRATTAFLGTYKGIYLTLTKL